MSSTGASLVLVLSQKGLKGEFRTGLILTRSDAHGNDFYRYVVLSQFQQRTDGKIVATVSADPTDDPLHYLGSVFPNTQFFSRWMTDRELLKLATDVNHPKPTAIFSLSGTLTLAPKFTDANPRGLPRSIQTDRQGEIPDFIVIANPGFAFHSGDPLESDHGGLAS